PPPTAPRLPYTTLFRSRAFPVARWRTPQYRPVFRVLRAPDSAFSWYGPPPDTVFPSGDRPGYTGPIAVLASNATAGAAEDFLVAFRNATRGVIIGETSAGSPGEALTIALPKNWAMQLSVTRHALDRKSTRLNSSHQIISYAVFCLKKKKDTKQKNTQNDN